MKLARLTDARFHAALRKLSAQPLPLRVAFKLKGVSAKVDQELKKFEEVRQNALERFGKKDAEGKLVTKPDGSVEFEPDMLRSFADQLNEVGQLDIDLGSVRLEELGDKLELTVEEITLLDGVVVE